MADISKIKLPNGTIYAVKDANAQHIIKLTNEDLNNVVDAGMYYANSGNTCATHIAIDDYEDGRKFSLEVKLLADGDASVICQILFDSSTNVYVRYLAKIGGIYSVARDWEKCYGYMPYEDKKKLNGIHSNFIGGSVTAAVTTSPYKPNLWKFNAGLTATDGMVISITTPNGGHDYGTFLSMNNGSNYYPIVLSGTDRMTTHYPSGSQLLLAFDSDGSAASVFPVAGATARQTVTGGVWRVLNYYDSGNTRNTAGSTDSSSKLFLIGATSQAANPQTYSHDTAYVGTDGCLYSGGVKVLTAHQDISGKLDKSGGTMTGALKVSTATMPVSGGKISGMTAGTSELYKDGLAISNPATPNDVGWMRCLGTGESDTVLEIATGDDGGTGEAIVFRGYNTSNAVAYQVNVPKSTGTIALTNQVVTLGDNQTITGAKTFSNINNLSYTPSGTSSIAPAPTSVGSVPWARDLWHDHFAFLICHAIESKESSVNGTSWTADTRDLTGLFTEKESEATQILKKDEKAFRFVFKNTSFAYSSLRWFEVSVAYTDPFSHFEVLIEHSADKTTWNTCHQSTITANSNPYYLYNNYSISVDGYTRFTFTKKTNETTGSVYLTCIKGLCTRKGNQGLGIELEYPYRWNANMDIYPANNNTSSLGTSSRKWANVYATTFNGNLTGNVTGNCTGTAGGVTWANVSDKPTSFTPTSHNQASNTVNAMTGYSKASSASAIAATDSLNTAIGKLEKGLDGKQASLTAQTAYSAKGSATKVPQITTNALGQVTGITEVTINDTKNTAGSTDTASKIYLIGALSQDTNPQTYSNKNLVVQSADNNAKYGNYTLLTIGASSRQGVIRFHSLNSYYNQLLPASGLTTNRDIVLPSSAGTLAITTSSSRRYKENIQPITEDEAKKILDVNIVSFDYIDKESYGDRTADGRYGVIAEELNEIIPSAVLYDSDWQPDAVDYSALVPHLIKMVQMQQKEIEFLKNKLN